jgi:hypothetical protein
MKTKHPIARSLLLLGLLSTINSQLSTVFAQGTAFTYQGRFNDGTNPATGIYDLRFAIYDAATGGTAAGALTNAATGITNGLFTVPLDFGGVFNGSNYWLELAARTNGGGAFTALNPRQPVLPTPYSIYAATAGNAGSVAAANIVGTVPLAQLPTAVVTNNETGANLTGTFTGNGGGLTNLPAASLTGTVADSLLSSNIARLNIPNTTVQATASVVVTAGFITGTTNLNGGSGYTTAPLVTVTDATGSNAVITATISNGVVVSLTVQAAGVNYSAGATLTIAPPPSNAYQTFNCGNVFNGVSTFNNPSNTFVGSFTGNGAGLTNVNLTGPSISSALGNTANGYLALATDTTGSDNTANGVDALQYNTTGSYNTANGVNALKNNTSGSDNTAVGQAALQNNKSGYLITAVGQTALFANTTGVQNTAVGAQALTRNTTGSWLAALGDHALFNNTSGIENTASGSYALFSNTTGNNNTADGYEGLYSNTTGNANTANGYQALYANTTGNFNTANGEDTLFSNTTGIENAANGGWALYSNTNGSYNTANGEDALHYNRSGSNNTANGFQSLFHNTTGTWNTANGVNALLSNTNGSFNTADGNSALNNNTVGSYNTASGFQSLWSNTTGSNNIALGSLAGYNITTGSSNIDIGNMGLATDTNIIRIGSGQTQAFIAGNVLIGGTTNAVERFEVDGSDTAFSPGCSIRIRNILDPIGGFIGDGWHSLQFGLYNPSASSVGIIAAGAKRSFFGFDQSGKVGSLANNFASPSYRNILDDGSGNMSITGVITGNGAALTNLNPAKLSSGTAAINISGNAATATTAASVTGNIADAQLSANVALLNGTNAFTGLVSGTFSGSGAGLTNLSANAISGGVNTNILIGSVTFYITNGIIMKIQ